MSGEPNPIFDVQRRNVPSHPLESFRNEVTIISAAIRGERRIILDNQDHIPSGLSLEGWQTHRKGYPVDQPYEFSNYNAYEPEETSDPISSDPDVNKIRYLGHRQWPGFRLEFFRGLGKGGFGVVSLWKAHFEGGETRRIVIKSSVGGRLNHIEEGLWHYKYRGGTHTTQLVDLEGTAQALKDVYLRANPGGRLQYPGTRPFRPSVHKVMVMEYMEHKDLFEVLMAIARRKTRLPVRAQWQLWECLVRAVAEVAYQPHFLENQRNFAQELQAKEREGKLGEFLEELAEIPCRNHVHLDVDEQNILVGERPDHPFQPVFKLHDLGQFSKDMDKIWRDEQNENIYWLARRPAKGDKPAPEQVHESWDPLLTTVSDGDRCNRFRGTNLATGERVAGRYGAWTNVFLMAKNMESAMNMLWRQHPFTHKPYTAPDGTERKEHTYAWRLLRPEYSEHLDPDLVDTICRCQHEYPADRPDVLDLLEDVDRRKKKGFLETGEEMRAWWDALFNKPVEEWPFARDAPTAGDFPEQERGSQGSNVESDDESDGDATQREQATGQEQATQDNRHGPEVIVISDSSDDEQAQPSPTTGPTAARGESSTSSYKSTSNTQPKVRNKAVSFAGVTRVANRTSSNSFRRHQRRPRSHAEPLQTGVWAGTRLPRLPVAVQNLLTRKWHLEANFRHRSSHI